MPNYEIWTTYLPQQYFRSHGLIGDDVRFQLLIEWLEVRLESLTIVACLCRAAYATMHKYLLTIAKVYPYLSFNDTSTTTVLYMNRFAEGCSNRPSLDHGYAHDVYNVEALLESDESMRKLSSQRQLKTALCWASNLLVARLLSTL